MRNNDAGALRLREDGLVTIGSSGTALGNTDQVRNLLNGPSFSHSGRNIFRLHEGPPLELADDVNPGDLSVSRVASLMDDDRDDHVHRNRPLGG